MNSAAPWAIPSLIDNERLGAFQWRVLALCFVIALFDGFDTQAIAFTGPAILAAFHLPAGSLAPILTAGIIGMTIGAMTLGMVGDRIGRRPTIMLSLAIFGCATLATAWSTDTSHILVLRFIAGVGMGGCTPVLLALAAEYGPARHRGAIMTGVLLGLPAGAMLGGLLAARMLPLIGWEGIFIVGGGAPLAVLVVIALMLPESLYFRAAQGGAGGQRYIAKVLSKILSRPLPAGVLFTVPESAVERASVRALFTDGNAGKTVAIWAIYLLNWVAWFMLLSWLPTVLKAAGLPAALRATATGWSIGMGRAGAILGSAIGGGFLAWGGPSGFFLALAVPLVWAGIAVLSLRLRSATAESAPLAAH